MSPCGHRPLAQPLTPALACERAPGILPKHIRAKSDAAAILFRSPRGCKAPGFTRPTPSLAFILSRSRVIGGRLFRAGFFCRIVARTMTPRTTLRHSPIVPIILAAGPPRELPFPKPLAPFGAKTALERALETCCATRGMAPPIVVLGCQAHRVLSCWRRRPPSRTHPATIVHNRDWRRGQLCSLLAGLRRLPPRALGFLLYPVDYPLLSPRLLARLLHAFHIRARGQQIVVPAIGRRTGHPILVSRELAPEFRTCARQGGTARDVIYRPTQPDRVVRVPVRDRTIFRDFDSPASYRLCLRLAGLRAARRSSARATRRPS